MQRVGVAGFLHESNTFLGVPTTYEQFAATSLTSGREMFTRWCDAHHELGGMLRELAAERLEAVPLIATFAVPSGTITAGAFEAIVDGVLEEIRKALPLDGLLLALHGATVSEAYRDADGEVLRRVRQLVGPDLLVVTTLDLHANVSDEMIRHATATVAYRSNPHLDQEQRGAEAAAILAMTLRGAVKPVQAIERPPMLMHISRQFSGESPARELYDDAAAVMAWPGILSASVAMGFPYADVEEMGANFWAVADGDEALARRAAQWMASRAWARRHEFVGQLPSPSEAVKIGAGAAETPVVLMDIGDNVGAGSPGDSTILFEEVLRQGVPNALVILYDPVAVEHCVQAGPGATVRLGAGANTDTRHGSPVVLSGVVRTLSDGKFLETQIRHGGWGAMDQGITAVVETPEEHTVVLTSKRMAPMSLEQILSLGIHPERKRILIVKGVVAPRAAYEPVAKRVLLVDTAGVTSDNPRHFDYKHRRVPLFPLEAEAQYGGS
ncbi:MAG: M81 family metallopeptidase [Bryobacteraceae bacterium]